MANAPDGNAYYVWIREDMTYDSDYADDDGGATRGRDYYFKEATCSGTDRNGSAQSGNKI